MAQSQSVYEQENSMAAVTRFFFNKLPESNLASFFARREILYYIIKDMLQSVAMSSPREEGALSRQNSTGVAVGRSYC